MRIRKEKIKNPKGNSVFIRTVRKFAGFFFQLLLTLDDDDNNMGGGGSNSSRRGRGRRIVIKNV
jgi:hypothetical protein